MRGAKAKRLRFIGDQLDVALPDADVPVKVRRLGQWMGRYQPRPAVAVPPTAYRARAGVPAGLRRGAPKVGRGCAGPSEKAVERKRRRVRDRERGAA